MCHIIVNVGVAVNNALGGERRASPATSAFNLCPLRVGESFLGEAGSTFLGVVDGLIIVNLKKSFVIKRMIRGPRGESNYLILNFPKEKKLRIWPGKIFLEACQADSVIKS
jgi:hypothetical protein